MRSCTDIGSSTALYLRDAIHAEHYLDGLLNSAGQSAFVFIDGEFFAMQSVLMARLLLRNRERRCIRN